MGFLSKIFGKDKQNGSNVSTPDELVKAVVEGITNRAGFDLSFEIKKSEEQLVVEFSGSDAEILTAREGAVLSSFQTFLKRVLQNKFPDARLDVVVDCNDFLESSANELREIAERLKKVALQKGQPSFVRALPPRERKIIHRYLAEDERVKSQSIGEGFIKKIRITPVRTRSERRPDQEKPGRF